MLNNHTMKNLDLSQIKSFAPAVFATTPSTKMSNKYSFIPTVDVLELFDQEGWKVSEARQSGKGIHNSHQLRMSHGELPKVGDSLVQAIIKNSHDGSRQLTIGAGLYRLVCSNGLTVPQSVADEFTIRHKNINIGEIRRITDEFAKRLPVLTTSVEKFQSKILTEGESRDFMTRATMLRWENNSVPTFNLETLLKPLRVEDEGNSLWKVFNVAQEKLVRGGDQYRTVGGRNSRVRSLSNFNVVNKINTKLWELADTYC